jgi:membrane-bound ClpP family serine protease
MHISSDAAFSAMSLGIFLIYAELCAPGLVVAGALGAVGFVGGGFLLWQKHLAWPGAVLFGAALMFMAAAILLHRWRIFAGLAIFCCCAGSLLLVRGADPISPMLGLPTSFAGSAVTIVLGRLAWKAHTNKLTR